MLVTSIFSFSYNVFSPTGHRPASLCHGSWLIVRRVCMGPSVRALTFSLNIFSETTHRILMQRNVPAMVFFRI